MTGRLMTVAVLLLLLLPLVREVKVRFCVRKNANVAINARGFKVKVAKVGEVDIMQPVSPPRRGLAPWQ